MVEIDTDLLSNPSWFEDPDVICQCLLDSWDESPLLCVTTGVSSHRSANGDLWQAEIQVIAEPDLKMMVPVRTLWPVVRVPSIGTHIAIGIKEAFIYGQESMGRSNENQEPELVELEIVTTPPDEHAGEIEFEIIVVAEPQESDG